jgi:hypothetical protein
MFRQLQNHNRLALRNLSARIDYPHTTLPQRLTYVTNHKQSLHRAWLTLRKNNRSLQYNTMIYTINSHIQFPYAHVIYRPFTMLTLTAALHHTERPSWLAYKKYLQTKQYSFTKNTYRWKEIQTPFQLHQGGSLKSHTRMRSLYCHYTRHIFCSHIAITVNAQFTILKHIH